MNNKVKTTFEREMKNAKFKKAFDESYKELVLSELLVTAMEEDNKSVRELAKEVHLSPTLIQNIRSGKQDDLKFKNFISIFHACGYDVVLEKGNKRIPLQEL